MQELWWSGNMNSWGNHSASKGWEFIKQQPGLHPGLQMSPQFMIIPKKMDAVVLWGCKNGFSSSTALLDTRAAGQESLGEGEAAPRKDPKEVPSPATRNSGRQGWKGEQKQVWVSQKGKKISQALPAYGNRKAHGVYVTQKPLQGFAETLKSFRTFWWDKRGLNSLQGFRCRKWAEPSLPNSLPPPPQQHRGMGSGGFSHQNLTARAAFLQSFLILGRGPQGLKVLFTNPAKILWCLKYTGVFLDRQF